MTAFVTTDLPASVNTVEKLAVWSATVLNHLYPDLTAIEENGQAELTAQASPFLINAVSPSQWRNIQRLSIPLDRNWQRGNDGIWASCQDLGSSAVPTEFKS